jgi:hypothetical protein
MLEQSIDGQSRPDNVRREAVHFDITPVAQNEPSGAIEHSQPLRHRVDGRVAPGTTLPQTPEADRPNQAGNRKTGCHARKGAKPECVFACEGHDISYMAAWDFAATEGMYS